jgi:hypothetical protein
MYDVWRGTGGNSIVSYSDFLRARQRMSRRNQRRYRAVMEALERRLLLTTFTVANLADDGRVGSLRYELEQAMAAGGTNTINFSSSLSGPIELLNGPQHLGPLVFDSGTNTTIEGNAGIPINGNDDATVFEIESGATVTLNNVTSTGGNYNGPVNAGDIYNDGILNVTNGSQILGVAAKNFHSLELPTGTLEGDGGGIFNDAGAILNVKEGSTVEGIAELGGAIYNNGGTVTLNDATILGEADTGGGLINLNNGNVTIVDSDFDGCLADASGGAIANEAHSSLTATDSTFTDGEAFDWGGGIANYADATMILNGDTISDNAALSGGGIFNYTGALLTVTGSTISGNTATLDGGGIENFNGTVSFSGSAYPAGITDNLAIDGAGVYNLGGSFTLSSSNVSGNTATGAAANKYDPYIDYIDAIGAGIDNTSAGSSLEQSTLTITNSTILLNTATTGETGGVAQGAGIYSNIGTVEITDTTINGNTASGDTFAQGGGIYSRTDTVQINSSTISNNTVTTGKGGPTDPAVPEVFAMGGGVDSAGGDTIEVVNSTIAQNEAIDTGTLGDAEGGGFWDAGFVTLTNCTDADNFISGSDLYVTVGSGIYLNPSGDTTINNTIVADNGYSQAGLTGNMDVWGPDSDLNANSSNNLISTRLADNGVPISGGLLNGVNGNIVGSEPNLGPLQNNGGPTDTMALLFGSPAINAGSNALALNFNGTALAFDQRGTGFDRIVTGTVDIGAYEYNPTTDPGSDESDSAANADSASGGSSGSAPSLDNSSTQPVTSTLVDLGQVAAPDATPSSNNTGVPYDPQQIDDAYGLDLLSFNGTAATGAGETIAIIDAYDDADIIGDANEFSNTFSLPEFNQGGSTPTLQVYNEEGQTTPLPVDGGNPNPTELGWIQEESLDVEWAHAIAPDANIEVFEATTQDLSDLLATVAVAKTFANVSVISMSWGFPEYASQTEEDSLFTTPGGHIPITFIASTGDDTSPDLIYPATSPNVLSVGGTRLTINSDGTYGGESAWDAGGGGVSLYESQPSYETGNVNGASTTNLTDPDISADADPYTGVFEYYTINTGSTIQVNWEQIGGTSLSAPLMAGMIALANQGRALNSLSTLNGTTQTLPMLFDAPASDFNNIAAGDNGYGATTGYDLATGLGSPLGYNLIPYLAGDTPIDAQLVFATQPTTTSAGQAISTVTIDVENGSGQVLTDFNSEVTISLASGPGTLGGTVTVDAVDGVAHFNDLVIDKAGTYTLEATTGDVPDTVSDSFSIVPAAAAELAFVQEPTTAAGAAIITPAITVAVEDQFGNVVTSDSSSVTLAIAEGTAGAALHGTTTEPDVDGLATFNVGINLAGTYELTATDGSLTSATSTSFVITSGILSQLGFKVQPSTTAAGADITPGVEVVLEDGGGNAVAGYTEIVTLSLASGSGTLNGTLSEVTVNGVATFSNLSIDTVGTYTLEASMAGNITGVSSSFTVTAAAASQLVFVDQPTAVDAGATISTPVVVDVEDQFGNLVTDDDSTVTLTLVSGGVLAGTTAVAASGGVATFTNLSPQAAGSQELKASDGSDKPGISSAFIVTAGPPVQIGFINQPTAQWLSSPLSPELTVGIEDIYGNVISAPSTAITLTLQSGPNGGQLLGNLTANTVNGVATFSNLTFNAAGSYVITASSEPYGDVVSSAITILTPPTRRYLFNGVPIGAVLVSQQQKADATSLPPASAVVAELDGDAESVAPAVREVVAAGASPSSVEGTDLFSNVPVSGDNLSSAELAQNLLD